ncbi:hypothetical protein KIM372_08860 [Bombiscardovia nodaiensis]|uniref:Uncharacterized protein n=1 Tax=Bombiscardovia nodaiensis TaxID=2932181 RepID=A0ABN6SA49_9BIFI|nr:hypothetical protein KIM372_08860 [Bombiscardovia nodaiensis]
MHAHHTVPRKGYERQARVRSHCPQRPLSPPLGSALLAPVHSLQYKYADTSPTRLARASASMLTQVFALAPWG